MVLRLSPAPGGSRPAPAPRAGARPAAAPPRPRAAPVAGAQAPARPQAQAGARTRPAWARLGLDVGLGTLPGVALFGVRAVALAVLPHSALAAALASPLAVGCLALLPLLAVLAARALGRHGPRMLRAVGGSVHRVGAAVAGRIEALPPVGRNLVVGAALGAALGALTGGLAVGLLAGACVGAALGLLLTAEWRVRQLWRRARGGDWRQVRPLDDRWGLRRRILGVGALVAGALAVPGVPLGLRAAPGGPRA